MPNTDPKPLEKKYRFIVTIKPGQDEWWEYVFKLRKKSARRAEVRAELARTMFDHGFDESYGTEIKGPL